MRKIALLKSVKEKKFLSKSRDICPLKDYAGNVLYNLDIIKHPISNEIGIIVYFKKIIPDMFFDGDLDRWRVVYFGEDGTYSMSRLSLQVGERGQAVKIKEGKQ